MSHVTRPDDSLVPSRSRDGDYDIIHTPGLTKREYFAAMAMQGLLANPIAPETEYEDNMLFAVQHADALIDQLNK
jgi:hypothetical protein